MNRISDSEHDDHPSAPPMLMNDEIQDLRLAYKRAFDEYVAATTTINDRIRHRILPTAEEFGRQRIAQFALVEARRAIFKANKSQISRPH